MEEKKEEKTNEVEIAYMPSEFCDTRVIIVGGEKFTVILSTGKTIELNHAEWIELRKVQNSLISSEPQ